MKPNKQLGNFVTVVGLSKDSYARYADRQHSLIVQILRIIRVP